MRQRDAISRGLRRLASGWTPLADASALMWHASGDWTDVSGGASEWNDRVNGALLQASSGHRPTISGDKLVFDGGNDYLEKAALLYPAGSHSLFVVTENVNMGAADALVGEGSSSDGDEYLVYVRSNTVPDGYQTLYRESGGPSFILNVSSTTNFNPSAVSIFEVVDTGSAYSMLIDGAEIIAPTAYTRPASAALDPDVFALGALKRAAASSFTQFDCYEVAATSATDATTRARYREFLAAKFGVTI